MKRRTKIVSTLGPATESEEKVYQLIEAGVNVARLNFSHGTHAQHKAHYEWVRSASNALKCSVGVLADLQGPKIRLGSFARTHEMWVAGEVVRITTDDIEGTHDRVSTTYKQLAHDAQVGDRMLVDDGKLCLTVTAVEGNDVVAVVNEGGPVSSHKGLSLPGMNVTVPALSEKDISDLLFALELGVDFIALSFVRSPDDVIAVHEIMDRVGRRVPIIGKLEKPEAVARLPEIINAFDAIMIARGDLGVEMPLEEVPVVQKRAITLARSAAKPVIVATQMLESMMQNSRPTRAETSDVANAVYDGADAVMLSGETSVGKYPIEAVKTMSRICRLIEDTISKNGSEFKHKPRTRSGVISYAARDVAERLEVKALVAFTESGDTARRLARLHPKVEILAFSPRLEVRSQLSLSWGVETFIIDPVETTDEMIEEMDRVLLDIGRYLPGETVVVVAGTPPNTSGSTNTITVHRFGQKI